jgi:ABC-type antimicrobial peptide transport system permease subunit
VKSIKQWAIYSVVGIIFGLILGYILLWIWFFITLFAFRHGDSGPGWIVISNRVVFIIGLLIGIVGAQILYHRLSDSRGDEN